MGLLRHPARYGRYQVTDLIASGGMGEVLRGLDPALQRPVAIKLLLPGLRATESRVRMFLDEARAVATLDHPNIVRVYDVGRQAGRNYLVMEWLDGWSLTRIDSRLRLEGALLPTGIAINWIVQACRGLHAAHEATTATGKPLNLVHRDVGPQNLVVTRGGVLKVVDIDGVLVGPTPLVDYPIPAGPHDVRLKNPDTGAERLERITVRAGGHVKRLVRLAPP